MKPVKIVLKIRHNREYLLGDIPAGTIFLWKNLFCMKTNIRTRETSKIANFLLSSDSVDRRIYIVDIKTGHMHLVSPGYAIDFIGGLE